MTTHALVALLNYMCTILLLAQNICKNHEGKSQKVTLKLVILLRSPDCRDMQLNATSSQDVYCQFSLTIFLLTNVIFWTPYSVSS